MLDDEKCLCGSGRLYSMCCKPFSGQGIENYKKEIDSKNYIKAYYIAVAMLSDYLEDVRKHTNRILKDNPVIGRFVHYRSWQIVFFTAYQKEIQITGENDLNL